MKENKDNFDDKLSHKIKKTFENYQEQYDPALWQTMQQRLKEANQSKELAVAIWKRKSHLLALGLFLVLSLGYVFFSSQQNQSKENLTEKPYNELGTMDSNKKSNHLHQNSSSNTATLTENKNTKDSAIKKEHILSAEDKTKPQSKFTLPIQPAIQEKEQSSSFIDNQIKGTDKQSLVFASKESKLQSLAPLSLKIASFHLDILVMSGIEQQQTAQDSTKTQVQTTKNRLRFALLMNFGKGFSDKQSQFKSKLGLGLGVGISKSIAKKWGVQTGILLQNYQWQRSASGLALADVLVQNSSNFSSAALLGNYEYALQTLWLEIPMGINYTLFNKPKWSLEASAGLSSFIYLKEKYTFPAIVSETVQIQNPTTGEISNQNRNTFAQTTAENEPLNRVELFNNARVGFALHIPIHQKYRLGIAPYYQFALSEMTQFQLKTRFVGVGFQLDFLTVEKTSRRKNNK